MTDWSQLAGFQLQQGPRAAKPSILPERISNELSCILVRKMDEKWFDLMRWTYFALASAEQEDVHRTNVAGLGDTANPDVRRPAGLESNLSSALGVGARERRRPSSRLATFARCSNATSYPWDRASAKCALD